MRSFTLAAFTLFFLTSHLISDVASAQCGGRFGRVFSGILRGGGGCGGGGDGGEFYSGRMYRGGYATGGWSTQCGDGGEFYGPSYSYNQCDGGEFYRTAPAPVETTGDAVVYLQGIPEGATLAINDKNYTRTGPAPAYRTFVSRNLMRGYDYDYRFVVQYRDQSNNLVIAKRNIVLKANTRTKLSLQDFAASVATNHSNKPSIQTPDLMPGGPRKDPATLEWDMPREARIFLDGKLVEAEDKRDIRRVLTPPLDPKKMYTWDIVVLYEEDDREVELKKSVKFTAGNKLVMGIGKDKLELVVSGFPEQMNYVAATPARTKER
jgi:uncharacterized protein (TIGR03000 family)